MANQADKLMGSVETLLSTKETLVEKEKELVRGLNKMLGKLGYQVVSMDGKTQGAKGVRRRGRKPGRKPGRPPKARKAGVGKRGPGRPRKTQKAGA